MPENDRISVRALALVPKTYKEDDHSVEAVLTTEDPAMVFDWERGIVAEVLLMDGLRGAKPGTVLPLLDSHNRGRSEDQIGSTEIIRIENGQVIGRRRFSQVNPRATVIEGMVREGHLRDGSIGYMVERAEWVEDGKTRKIKGREFAGPMKVATLWRLLEDSTTPIGADPKAKVRSEPSAAQEDQMNEAIKAKLVALGMKAEATDEEIVLFVETLQVKSAEPEPVAAPEPVVETKSEEELKAENQAQESARMNAILDMARLAGLVEFGAKLVTDKASVDEARKALLVEAEKSGRFGGQPAAPVGKKATEKGLGSEAVADMICRAGLMR